MFLLLGLNQCKIQATTSEVSDTEGNDPDTVVQPVDDPIETSSSSEERTGEHYS